MHEWSESQLMIRDAVRTFVENEIAPHVEELEHGDMPPYELMRKMYKTFGMDEMARARFAKTIEAEKRGEKPTKAFDSLLCILQKTQSQLSMPKKGVKEPAQL